MGVKGVLVDLVLAGAMVLGGSKVEASLVNPNSIIRDNIEYLVQTDKSIYNLEEDVEITYRITNRGSETAEFYFPVTQILNDFTVEAETTGEPVEIWKNGFYKAISSAPTSFGLLPEESKEFSGVWTQYDKRISPPPLHHPWHPTALPGDYTIFGSLVEPYMDESKIGVDITIIPEPSTIGLLGLGSLALINRRRKNGKGS